MSNELRQRVTQNLPDANAGAGLVGPSADERHPGGPVRHGAIVQALRIFVCSLYLLLSLIATAVAQYVGTPLYFVNKSYYYAYMSITKEFFGLLVNTTTQWFNPTIIRISGDASVRNQLMLNEDGRLMTTFPDRLVMIANHQLYTDWLYLWWTAYTSRMHGHIYIILKESLKYIPIIGTGMQFYSFIFLARNWAKDKPRMEHRLAKLRARHNGTSTGMNGTLDPMWLLVFPEGTNLSANTRKKSVAFAEKAGLEDMKHQLLPRSTGLQFCLQELQDTVEWVYDCTIAYEGIPHGQYGQDIYTLMATYFQGRVPPSVNMYWRRFAVSSMPVSDPKAFENWVRERWIEKDRFIEQYLQTGRFPADEGDDYVARGTLQTVQSGPGAGKATGAGAKLGPGGYRYLETEVRNKWTGEWLLVFLPALLYTLIGLGLYKSFIVVMQ